MYNDVEVGIEIITGEAGPSTPKLLRHCEKPRKFYVIFFILSSLVCIKTGLAICNIELKCIIFSILFFYINNYYI